MHMHMHMAILFVRGTKVYFRHWRDYAVPVTHKVARDSSGIGTKL